MKQIFNFVISTLFLSLLFPACGKKQTKLTSQQVEDMVAEAYVHCFPIVENYKAIYFYAVLEQSPKFAPMNTVTKETRLYTSEDKFVVSPNNDTYYTIGVLDLRAEPIIIKVPESKGRYYVFQLVGQTTDNFNYIGTRLTGDKAGVYAITSPYFKGKLPAGVTEINAPSEFVVVVGRTAVNADDPKDREEAKKLQDQYEVAVMSKFYPEFKPQTAEKINFPIYSEATITTDEFFSTLNFLLSYMKLSEDEQKIIDKYASIGVIAGQPYTFVKDNPQYKDAVEAGIKKGLEKVDELVKNMGTLSNGWSLIPTSEYYFGNDYDLRTAVARFGIYANCPIEAYYPIIRVDKDGQTLNGENTYSLTFPAKQLPPVKYFWSLTMYDSKNQLLVANKLNRYSIGDRTKGIKYNKDGSLTLYFGNKEPKEGTSNWLPAPKEDFNMVMRLYGPKEEVLNKSWVPYPIVKINK